MRDNITPQLSRGKSFKQVLGEIRSGAQFLAHRVTRNCTIDVSDKKIAAALPANKPKIYNTCQQANAKQCSRSPHFQKNENVPCACIFNEFCFFNRSCFTTYVFIAYLCTVLYIYRQINSRYISSIYRIG